MDVLVFTHANAANGKDIHLPVTRIGGEDFITMGLLGSKQHISKGFTINLTGNLASRQVDESRQNIHPTDHGIGSLTRFDSPGPVNL